MRFPMAIHMFFLLIITILRCSGNWEHFVTSSEERGYNALKISNV